jgi:hypothetical protein
MLRRVNLIRTDVSEESIASVIRVTRIGELGTLAVTSNRIILQRNIVALNIEVMRSFETSVLTRATWRRENLKYYLATTCSAL